MQCKQLHGANKVDDSGPGRLLFPGSPQSVDTCHFLQSSLQPDVASFYVWDKHIVMYELVSSHGTYTLRARTDPLRDATHEQTLVMSDRKCGRAKVSSWGADAGGRRLYISYVKPGMRLYRVYLHLRIASAHHLFPHIICPNAIIFSNAIHNNAPCGKHLSARDRSYP